VKWIRPFGVILTQIIGPKPMASHKESIIDQFTRQAVPFAQVPGHTNEKSLQLLIEMAEASAQDTVLDVACGPGIVACALAPMVNQVTGIDMTPALLEQAKSLAHQRGLRNVSWQEAEGEELPFAEGSFSIVLSRYAFHHCMNPKAVFSEMLRVCCPGGKVLIADVVLPSKKINAYDHLERLRDPSHVHALSHEELKSLVVDRDLRDIRLAFYKVEIELEQQMAASFPNAGDEAMIRRIFNDDIGIDKLGINAHRVGSEIHYEVPITILVAQKPG
jgi:ubiquinone/menaquinone biosynthesis C-methylase UbiE